MIEIGDAFLRRAGGAPHDGLVRSLSRRFSLAVITNTHDPNLVPDHLKRMGVSRYFARVVTSVEVGVRKSARHIFEHAMRALHISPHQCVYVGDSYESDYQGARGVDIRSLLIDPLHKAPVPSEDRLASILLLEGWVSGGLAARAHWGAFPPRSHWIAAREPSVLTRARARIGRSTPVIT